MEEGEQVRNDNQTTRGATWKFWVGKAKGFRSWWEEPAKKDGTLRVWRDRKFVGGKRVAKRLAKKKSRANLNKEVRKIG